MLVGSDYYYDIVEVGKPGERLADGIVAIPTAFGIIICGPDPKRESSEVISNFVDVMEPPEIVFGEFSEKKFDGILSEIADDGEISPIEYATLREFKDSITQDEISGEYTVALPVLKNKNIRDVPRNEKIAFVFAKQALEKVQGRPELFTKISKIFNDHIARGFVERTKDAYGTVDPSSYLP